MSVYCLLYIARTIPLVIKGHCTDVIWHLKLNMFLRQYLKYQQKNIEGISSFRLIIIIIMIYCPKWKIRNGKSFLEILLPNWSWARQPLSSARSTLLYPFQMLSAKQGSSNSHLLTSFGMTRPGIEPTTSRLWGGRSTDWANTHRWLWLWKCQKFLSSLASLARIYIHFLNVSVLSVYCHLYNSIIPWRMKGKCVDYVMYTCMYEYVIWDLKMNVFLRQSIWSSNKILKEIAVLEYENVKKNLSSLAYS